MSANAVFNVTELFEMIMLQLPTKDILLAQRVSRIFRDTIAGSKPLQRALFMTPGEVKDMVADAHGYNECVVIVKTSQGSTTLPPKRRVIEVVFNPLLVDDLGSKNFHSKRKGKAIGVLNAAPLLSKGSNLSSFNNMYLTQPPLKFYTKDICLMHSFTGHHWWDFHKLDSSSLIPPTSKWIPKYRYLFTGENYSQLKGDLEDQIARTKLKGGLFSKGDMKLDWKVYLAEKGNRDDDVEIKNGTARMRAVDRSRRTT